MQGNSLYRHDLSISDHDEQNDKKQKLIQDPLADEDTNISDNEHNPKEALI